MFLGYSYFFCEGLVFLYDFNGWYGGEDFYLFIFFNLFSKLFFLFVYENGEFVGVGYLIEDFFELYFVVIVDVKKDE